MRLRGFRSGPVRVGRSGLWALLLIAALLVAAGLLYRETSASLAARVIATGFGFLSREAGFAIGEVLPVPVVSGSATGFLTILSACAVAGGAVQLLWRWSAPAATVLKLAMLVCLAGVLMLVGTGRVEVGFAEYGPQHSFGFALLTGFANTLKVSLAGIVLASAVGLLVGLARLSSNLLVRSAAAFYVETLRNIPLLIQVFFWYFGVLRALPPVRNSIDVLGLAAFNNRGVFLPRPEFAAGSFSHCAALAAAVLALVFLRQRAVHRQRTSGRRPAVVLPFFCLLALLTAIAWIIAGPPLALSYPTRVGFNFKGGITLTPEFAALLLGISLYAAAFIAEIVRSGVQGVNRGQWEAAISLGLPERRILRLVVLPQAMRVIFPPLISQYLSLVKDSSLGIAIAFPELVSISNTMINQTGQPIEILTITITAFMAMNLLIASLINRYNEARPWIVR
jgi:general L-amino acid transport system permease protein